MTETSRYSHNKKTTLTVVWLFILFYLLLLIYEIKWGFFFYFTENYSRRVRKSTNKKILALPYRTTVTYCIVYPPDLSGWTLVKGV